MRDGGLRALAVLALAGAGLQAPAVQALGLAELTVQSPLGAPLRAEIRVTDVSTEDLATLRAAIPPSETFLAAGADYHPPLGTVTVTVARRADGTPVLRLAGTAPVTETMIDLLVDASTATGRVLRDYTLQFPPAPASPARAKP